MEFTIKSFNMKLIIKSLVAIVLYMGISLNTFAHEEHHSKHTNDKNEVVEIINTASSTNVNTPTSFSTFHPLIVHFPIVLILIAALLQIGSLVYSRANWDYITLFLLTGGVLGAYLSSSFFHPHAEGLTAHAQLILERHELFAELALYSSGLALFLKLIDMLVFNIANNVIYKSKKIILKIVITLILVSSAVSVSIAGHWGANLTHVEGVGPQGKFIEIE